MVRFEIIGNSFSVKDRLKTILPKTKSKWSWKNNKWVLTIQSNQDSVKFRKQISEFCTENSLHLSSHVWDGFNKTNNY